MVRARPVPCLAALRLAAALCLVAPALAGCGRKGALEPPSGLPQTQATSQAAQTRVLQDMDTPGLIQSPNQVYEESAIAKLNSAVKNPARPINAPPAATPGSFLLDPLVK